MGVYIPDMKMPKTCAGCDFVEPIGLVCTRIHKFLDREDYRHERHKDCLLVEIPSSHGRLIDVENGQTIIEAEWSENHE